MVECEYKMECEYMVECEFTVTVVDPKPQRDRLGEEKKQRAQHGEECSEWPSSLPLSSSCSRESCY